LGAQDNLAIVYGTKLHIGAFGRFFMFDTEFDTFGTEFGILNKSLEFCTVTC
jgi:hypothetical protein